jgi:hypothetical protein
MSTLSRHAENIRTQAERRKPQELEDLDLAADRDKVDTVVTYAYRQWVSRHSKRIASVRTLHLLVDVAAVLVEPERHHAQAYREPEDG